MRHASICLGVNVEKIKEKHKSPTLGNQKPDLPQETYNPEAPRNGLLVHTLHWDGGSLHRLGSRLPTVEGTGAQRGVVGGLPAKQTQAQQLLFLFF